MKKVFVFMMLGACSLFAADGSKLYAAKCAECHGKDGKDTSISGKAITGGGTLAKLNGYKNLTFGGAQKETMLATLADISSTDLQSIAAHVDTLK